jgi:DNA-binding NtrC family response regulator
LRARVEAAGGSLIGDSRVMRELAATVDRAGKSDANVLVLGESGTGKEVVAKSVHDASDRKSGPFVALDCGSIPASLAESILFGHEKGVFTGATERKKGALAEAHGGTLFLDELGELPLELQPKLLRVLAERQVKRVGGNTLEPIDVRVLAATRRDLGVEMNAGRFRSDLFFRIAQVRVELPALRERLDDLPLLVAEICKRAGKPAAATVVEDWIERRLGSYDWPGNVRELVNVAQVAATLADTPDAIDDVLTLARDSVADEPQRGGGAAQTAFAEAKRSSIASFEREYFTQLSRAAKGNVSEMARQSGMERHHVRAYLRKYGIEKG